MKKELILVIKTKEGFNSYSTLDSTFFSIFFILYNTEDKKGYYISYNYSREEEWSKIKDDILEGYGIKLLKLLKKVFLLFLILNLLFKFFIFSSNFFIGNFLLRKF